MGYYSAITKNKIMPFAATCMELEILILSELGQKEKDKYHTLSLICEILSMAQMILSTKQRQITAKDSRVVIPGRGWGSGINRLVGFFGCKLLYLECSSLYSTGNCVRLGHFTVQQKLKK